VYIDDFIFNDIRGLNIPSLKIFLIVQSEIDSSGL